MSDDFWDRVKRGSEKLSIPEGTVNVWKHRGRVPRHQIKPIYSVLAGTNDKLTYEQLLNEHK